MAQRAGAPRILFEATPSVINGQTVVRLPDRASKRLPSRGQVAAHGTVNGHAFQTVLEPDGVFGHWMRIDPKLQRASGVSAGDTVRFELQPAGEWPEPDVPPDLATALATAPKRVRDVWQDITPMARWEWVRWLNATNNAETRERRVEATISKMDHGKRRPCCFNLASCTDPDLSRNGKLAVESSS